MLPAHFYIGGSHIMPKFKNTSGSRLCLILPGKKGAVIVPHGDEFYLSKSSVEMLKEGEYALDKYVVPVQNQPKEKPKAEEVEEVEAPQKPKRSRRKKS